MDYDDFYEMAVIALNRKFNRDIQAGAMKPHEAMDDFEGFLIGYRPDQIAMKQARGAPSVISGITGKG